MLGPMFIIRMLEPTGKATRAVYEEVLCSVFIKRTCNMTYSGEEEGMLKYIFLHSPKIIVSIILC
jgi:hypothetical protein